MNVIKLGEWGCEEALLGLGLSYGKTENLDCIDQLLVDDQEALMSRAEKLSSKGNGHNNFLCQIITWWKIKAPLYWWKQMDRYRVGKDQQSSSTMHTIMNSPLTQDDFESPILESYLFHLNLCISEGNIQAVQNALPSGYLQERVVSMSYMTILNILKQRSNHKLGEWATLISIVSREVNHPNLLKVEE